MLKQTSKEFRAFFLMEFTKQLIRNMETDELGVLQRVTEIKIRDRIRGKGIGLLGEEKGKEIQEIDKEILSPIKLPIESSLEVPKISAIRPIKIMPQSQRLQRPGPSPLMAPQRFPPTIQHIRPTPTAQQIDLGKLNALIQDPTVTVVECKGPGKKIIVKRMRETRITKTELTGEEIDEIIQKFSQTAKIPVHEGSFRVAVGRLILSAIISEVIGTKFIISKMLYM